MAKNEGSLGICISLRPTPRFESLNVFERECPPKFKINPRGVQREADCEGL